MMLSKIWDYLNFNTMNPHDDIFFLVNMEAHEINLVLIHPHPVKQSFSISTSFLRESSFNNENCDIIYNPYVTKKSKNNIVLDPIDFLLYKTVKALFKKYLCSTKGRKPYRLGTM